MSTTDQDQQRSRVVQGRYPPPGTSPIADAIRARRGARGITPLDAVLLHVPPVASGWNSLLGAIRTQGKLPGNVRELMILRVGALNGAAYEWVHHEHVGREAGLTTEQLYVIRDTQSPLPPSAGTLTPLQTAALVFTDQSTRRVQVEKSVIDAFLKELRVLAESLSDMDGTVGEKAEDLYVEAAVTVAVYNGVSRFLVSTDVAGSSDSQVPWPLKRKEHLVEISSGTQHGTTSTHKIHAITIESSPTSPWLVFSNSLLMDLAMWSPLIPLLISSQGKSYNILIHSQRGHGTSTLPSQCSTTIPLLASDIAQLLKALDIPTPVHAVVGVSQGGAAALALARSWPELTKSVVACDTSAKTPAGNREAWAGRIGLVFGGASEEAVIGSWDRLSGDPSEGEAVGKGWDYANKVGMKDLANLTVPRWFGPGSKCAEGEDAERSERREWVKRLVEDTGVKGFISGAGALADYDLLQPDKNGKELFSSPIERVLLIAGSLDGGGKVGSGLKNLKENWNAVRARNSNVHPVDYVEIGGAGHLPMIDETERFAEVLRGFLDNQ